MPYIAKNNAYATIASAVAAVDTTITVQSGKGALFAVSAPYYTYATIENSAGDIEIVKVTAVSGDVLTVVRAQDGTIARAWNIGDVIECRPCAAAMSEKSDIGHNHDGMYSPVSHNHDSVYAPKGQITTSGLTQNTSRLLGRTSAGIGAVEEITVGTGLSLAGGALNCTVTAPVTSVVGQTGNVTSAQIMTALQAIDGSGSGLDADLLDGQHASAFAAASHNHDGVYSPVSHNHDSAYVKLGGNTAIGAFHTEVRGSPFTVGAVYTDVAGGVGSWKCVQAWSSGNEYGILQRIA